MKQLSFDFGEEYARDRIRESPLAGLSRVKDPAPKAPPLKVIDSDKLVEVETKCP